MTDLNTSPQNHPPHDCDKVIKQIELALDGQLSDSEEKQLVHSLEECNYCMKKYNIEKSFKELIIASIKKKCAPQNLIDQIKGLVSGQFKA
jgi:anti-sigma factor (TIGR02949 family)